MGDLSQYSTLVYTLVGVLILGNLGTILTVLIATHKIIWWASEVDSRVRANERSIGRIYNSLKETREEFKLEIKDLHENVKFN